MGYTFRIGNATPSFDKDNFPHLGARWVVEPAVHPDAPVFEHDEMTGNSNSRSPSYSVWADFCHSTGLSSLFYDYRGHLKAGHPGCMGITQDDADFVTEALKNYRKEATLEPGFEADWQHEGPATRDYHLARLIWLEFWMQWAVKNCETPAIENT